jgi:hypothetical protein
LITATKAIQKLQKSDILDAYIDILKGIPSNELTTCSLRALRAREKTRTLNFILDSKFIEKKGKISLSLFLQRTI